MRGNLRVKATSRDRWGSKTYQDKFNKQISFIHTVLQQSWPWTCILLNYIVLANQYCLTLYVMERFKQLIFFENYVTVMNSVRLRVKLKLKIVFHYLFGFYFYFFFCFAENCLNAVYNYKLFYAEDCIPPSFAIIHFVL